MVMRREVGRLMGAVDRGGHQKVVLGGPRAPDVHVNPDALDGRLGLRRRRHRERADRARDE